MEQRDQINDEFGKNVFEQFMELFVLPEVKRKQESGELEKPIDLYGAQIVFFPKNRKPQVRINSEVKGFAEAKLRPELAKEAGEDVFQHELEHIQFIDLSEEEDPNCGYATLLRYGDIWSIAFDFRYNKALSKKHIETAKEFYYSAKFSFEEKHWSPFIDNLFCAAELSAKSVLLSASDPEFREKATHKVIKSRYNQEYQSGNLDTSHRAAFNKLSNLRGGARYLKGDVSVSEAEAQELLNAVEDMIEDADRRVG
jgi:HEPN domain-containing protein